MIDLKLILKQHPTCLNSSASLKSALMDKYPSEKRTVNILTILFECGIVNKIKAKKFIDENEMHRLIAQIEKEYGILGQYAQDAIMIWAAAFDVTVSTVKVNPAGIAVQELSKTPETKPIVYAQANVDDYEVVQKEDGYYITRFNGFEEEEMTIPSVIDGKKIKGIAENVFKGCTIVKKIYISEGIEVIENDVFRECKALENVTLPDTLQRIGAASLEFGRGAFQNTRLKAITIPQNVRTLGWFSFCRCIRLEKVELSDQITAICSHTFQSCGGLTEIKLPDSLESIGDYAFQYCCNLTEIKLPNSLESIGNRAFGDCRCLTVIKLPDSVKIIGKSAFYRCSSLTEIKLPDSLESIGNHAFWDCTRLTEIKLPDSLKTISESAFSHCSSLTKIKLPSSLVTIENEAFFNCRSLREVHIPVGTQKIGRDAFKGTKLSAIYIPPTVTVIGDASEESVFGDDSKNLTVYCASGSLAMYYARNYHIRYVITQF